MLRHPHFDLLGFGIAAVDEILEVAQFPAPGAKAQILARARYGGGLCGTALVAAARLGLRCRYAGILGANELSDFTRSIFAAEGIACPGEIRHPAAQPCHSVIVVERPTGERTILYSYEGLTAPSPDDLPRDLIASARAVYLDHLGPEAGHYVCSCAREMVIPTIADLERVEDPAVRALIPLIDHLILSARIAAILTGTSDPAGAARSLHQGRACTAVTDGVRGCWFLSGSNTEILHQPAFHVPAVDTTGCGDVFHGAYAAGLLSSLSIPESIRFASSAAALKATQPGGQAGIPNRARVEELIRSAQCPSAFGNTVTRSPVLP